MIVQKNAQDPPYREVEEIELEKGHLKQNGAPDTSQEAENIGSCFQPFYFKRQKRRPGKSKQPRPVVILESISEENAEEEITEESPHKKQDKNDNQMGEESTNVIIKKPNEEELTETIADESSPA
ncbi:hypothetical protein AC249_AIPGENE3641 [Exaiptasia diaphana]|nr:hypothetical protein AC249_AIPGENE3641 [Exaiptasia diaphana]